MQRAPAIPEPADRAVVDRGGTAAAITGWLLAASAFAGAGLAFLVEPMVARMLLPTHGGSAAVWTTALVFFQLTLVAGYAWAHLGLTRLGVRRFALVHAAAAAATLVALPVTLPGWAAPPEGVPVSAWLVTTLAAMVGLPFLVLAANGPTVQRWLAALPGTAAREPYRLFAASNAGSLAGLLAYPLLVQPSLDLPDQARWWAIGFGGFALLTAVSAILVARAARPGWDGPFHRADPPSRGRAEAIPVGRRLRWLVLAGIPAALLVGVTTHLSTDVAAVPLLWVIPLALYLVTLILAYARARPLLAAPARIALVPLGIVATLALAGLVQLRLEWQFAVHLGTLVAAGLALHGELAADRPPPAALTGYTLVVAAGGALGGLAAGVLGPAILPVPLEEEIAVVLAVALVVPGAIAGRPRTPSLRLLPRGAVAVAMVALLVAGQAATPAALATVRSFYGTYRVVDDGNRRHVLYAGTTIHGIQDRTPGQEREPWSYYARSGPLGQVLTTLTGAPDPLRIGAVGLGTGAIAAYGRPGDEIDFIEIDPAVVALARDPRLFTYLADSAASVEVAIGDGRLVLEATPAASYDVLVLDAFSSDAIPVHLLTVEGLRIAIDRVRPGGAIAVHISNRYLDLEPIVAAGARDLGLVSIIGTTLTPAAELGRSQASQWVVIGRSYADLAGLVSGSDWRTAHAEGRAAWTDRWSDLLGALRTG